MIDTAFLLGGILLFAITLVVFALPFFTSGRVEAGSMPLSDSSSALAASTSVLHDQLKQIDQSLEAGEIDKSTHRSLVAELKKQFLLDNERLTEASDQPFPGRAYSRLVLVLGALLVFGAGALFYARFGAYQAVSLDVDYQNYLSLHQSYIQNGQLPEAALSDSLLHKVVDQLEKEESNQGYRYMLASLHLMRNEFVESAAQYKSLLMENPAQERLLSEYLQVLYLASDRVVTDRVRFVAERALELNPHNPEVLGLLAMDAYGKSEFEQAIDYWQSMLPALPADSERARMVRFAIEEAGRQLAEKH